MSAAVIVTTAPLTELAACVAAVGCYADSPAAVAEELRRNLAECGWHTLRRGRVLDLLGQLDDHVRRHAAEDRP